MFLWVYNDPSIPTLQHGSIYKYLIILQPDEVI